MLTLAAFAIPIVSLVMAVTSRRRLENLEKEHALLRGSLSALERELSRRTVRDPGPAPTPETATPPPVEPEPAAAPMPEEQVTIAPTAYPVPIPDITAASPIEKPGDAIDDGWEVVPGAAYDAVDQPEMTEVASDAAFEALPPEPPMDAPAAVVPPPPPPPRKPFDWEALVGVKLFSWIAGIALSLAAVYLMGDLIKSGFLTPTVRAVIGTGVGISLLAVCELKFARGYRTTANAMDGAGVAILYSTFFAANSLWHLLNATALFALLILVTAVAVALSIRRESMFIALLGLVGGFMTPYMLSTGQDRPIGLFGYLLLLNAGMGWVAYKRRWPVLTVLSLAFTTIYEIGWVAKFLTSGKLTLATGIFLLFPIAAVLAMLIGNRSREDKASRLFERTAATSALVPLFFSLYLATVPSYGAQFKLLFGFLLIVDVGLFFLATYRKMTGLHGGAGLSTLLVFVIWSAGQYKPFAFPVVLLFALAFIALYSLAELAAQKLRATELGGLGSYAAAGLFFFFAFLVTSEPAVSRPALLFTTVFAALAIVAFAAIRSLRGGPYFLASFFVVATEALWSSKYLDDAHLLSALGIYAVFALFFIGVPTLARQRGRELQPRSGSSAFLMASLLLLLFIASGPVAAAALWGLGILLVLLNAAIFLESSATRQPFLTVFGALVSWIVITVFWSSVTIAAHLIPALALVAGLAMVVLAGNLWAARQVSEAGATSLSYGRGMYLGLIGHVFVAFVAGQRTLSIPPWPFLGVLAVLTLAIGIASLYARRAGLHVGSMVANAIVLMIWTETATTHPWPSIAFAAAVISGAYAVSWSLLATRHFGERSKGFDNAALVALLMAPLVSALGSDQPGAPGFGLTFGLVLAVLLTTLVFLYHDRRTHLSLLSVPSVAIALVAWGSGVHTHGWLGHKLIFAAAVLLTFCLFPLFVDRRDRSDISPYQAAVLASVAVFLFCRAAIMEGGGAGVIGLLPIVEAAAMTLLLVHLLRLQRAGERHLGRLALVAGTALGYVTLAIPLQLDKQWITIGWALEAAALAWLYQRIRHRGLLYSCTALAATVFVRLVLNRNVLGYHARGSVVIFNWYLYTYLVAAIALGLAAYLLTSTDDHLGAGLPRLSRVLYPAATMLLFLLLNIEIADFYSTGSTLTFNFSSNLAQDLTYTLTWAIFAIGMLITGLIVANKPTRIAALILLVVTIFKCFLHDLGRLGKLYRVGSLVGLAISLALVAILLQKYVLQNRDPDVPRQLTP
ncbi:MAG TPA: DUF2339 domain-containing protein [Thermoanaerobaculia bacterium]|nr:DUF2339 domain-containing protein [Thermoanaerobaculia bacterium]